MKSGRHFFKAALFVTLSSFAGAVFAVPQFNVPLNHNTNENQTLAYKINVSDSLATKQVVAARILPSPDAGKFTLDTSALPTPLVGNRDIVLNFKVAPNYESPDDANSDRTYEVRIEIENNPPSAQTRAETFFITVQDINDKPVAVDDPFGVGGTINEDTDLAATGNVLTNDTDQDGDTLSVQSVDGTSANGATITNNGNGTFKYAHGTSLQALDTGDTVNDTFNYVVTDGSLTDTGQVTVRVTGVNDAPTITSNSGNTLNVNHVENSTATITTVTASDVDGDDGSGGVALTFSLDTGGGADHSFFNISAGGALSFKTGQNYENPQDNGADRTYEVTVKVADNEGASDTQLIRVTVTNDSETTPTFSTTATPNADENQTAVIDINVNDPDPNESHSFAITGGADSARFSIVSGTGVLTFQAAPNHEAPTDAGTNNVYNVQVTVTDIDGNTAIQNLAVTVNDLTETAPTITGGATAAVNFNENATGTVRTIAATDPDAADTQTWSISGGVDAGDFNINSSTGALTFKNAPNHEAPDDSDTNNVYVVDVRVTDLDNNTDTQTVTVTVLDLAETAPTFATSGTPSVNENQTTVIDINVNDPDAAETHTFAITGGADSGKFSIVSGTGVLSFQTAPNHEAPTDAGTNNVYDVQVTVTDADNNSVAQNLAVTVNDLAETAPTFSTTATPSADENQTSVIDINVNDPDAAETHTFAITGGADSGKFSIVAGTGVLSFQSAPNHEAPTDAGTNNVYDVQVTVTDADNNSVAQNLAVTVNDLTETAPTITGGASAAVNFNENATGTVTTIAATDPDAADTQTWSISGGVDAGDFNINSSTGALTFKNAPNHEAPDDSDTNNVYVVDVRVTDLDNNTDTQTVTVTVQDLAETAPTFATSATPSADENQTAVIDINVNDPDAAETHTFAITGGADSGKFSIVSGTGVLSFQAAPNHEAPTDAGANNVYDVQVTVTDADNNSVAQNLAVTVNDLAETTPTFSTTATPSADENQTSVIDINVNDPDAAESHSFAITGGADSGKFSIVAGTGVLSFQSAPNHEAPTDAGTNNVYNVQVTVTDADSNTAVQDLAVTVNDLVENAPVITGGASAAVNFNENATGTVTTIAATDSDAAETLTFSLNGGADVGDFNINSSSGALTFKNAPNHESPDDADTNNVYVVIVRVTDLDNNTDDQTVTVTVQDLAETAPNITTSTSQSVNEGTSAVATLAVSDPDAAETHTWAITGGADSGDFSINSSTGALSFSATPNHEAPADSDTNNVYLVQVTVTDADNNTDVENFTITVNDLAETTPDITSNGGAATAAINFNENSTANVTTVAANDPDAAEVLTFSISGGADSGDFSINSSTGVLTFQSAPNHEAPADSDTNNTYVVEVTVTDLDSNTDTQTITVTVQDLAETTPAITSNGGGNTAAINFNENSTANVTTVTANDPDAAESLTFSISGTDAGDFSINVSTGVLTFQSAPNHEAPADSDTNNTYVVVVTVTDLDSNTDSQTITVTVQDLTETAPTITGGATAAVNFNENATGTVTTIAATDPDAAETLTFSLTGGADVGDFNINSSTGALTFQAAPNHEAPVDADTNNVYVVEVTVTDLDSNTDVQTVTVTVQDLAETTPNITTGTSLNVNEGVTSVVTFAVNDPDAAETHTWAITGGADSGDFSINSSTGALSFSATPNHEAPADADTNNVYVVEITVTDADSNTDVETFNITVNDLAETTPAITSNGGGNTAAINFNENSTANVTTVTANDPDAAESLTFSISGTDAGDFSINSSTGVLTFQSAPNHEAPADSDTNNTYVVVVTVTDLDSNTDSQTITVTVQDLTETAPTITGGATAAVNFNENATGTVTTIAATDPDAAETLTFSLTGGADVGDFNINSSTGALTFQAAPNHEAPVDADTNNVYVVNVTVTDLDSNTDVQTVTVTVQDLAETAPTITSTATPSANENQTAVVTVTVSDPDAAEDHTFSITGGVDSAKFSIDANSGVLTFDAAPDFETATDSGTNNVYDVQVTATDLDSNTAVQNIAVTVNDLNDNAPVFTTSASQSHNEGSTSVVTLATTDADGVGTNPPTFTINGGADQGDFTITGGNTLSFSTAPDFESPADADTNNSYVVQVRANDGANTTDLTITVSVNDLNDSAPVFTTANTQSVSEGTTTVVTLATTDADGVGTNPATFSIVGGADQGDFTLAGGNTLTFAATPDFEAAADANTDNAYVVTVRANDGANDTDLTITVSVTNVNEAPSATNLTNTVTWTEDDSSVDLTNIVVSDVDDSLTAQTITATLTLANINAGALSTPGSSTYTSGSGVWTITGTRTAVNSALASVAFVPRADHDTDTSITTQIRDQGGLGPANGTITLDVTAVNDIPAFSIESGDSDAQSVTETNAGLTAADTITLSDPDTGETVSTSVTTVVESSTTSGIANATLLGYMSISGDLSAAEKTDTMSWSFNSGSEAFNYLAAGESLVLTYTVQGDDGNTPGTDEIAITVNGTNDAPVLSVTASDSDAESLTETNAGLTVADTITVTDLDKSNTVSASVTTVVESGTTSGIANATLLGYMSISGSLDNTETTEALAWTFNSGSQAFNYLAAGESLVLTYTVQVDDGTAQDTDQIVITINGANDAPVLTVETGDSDAESLTETNAGLSVADTITVTDNDVTNTVSSSVTTVVESGTTSGIANSTLLGYMSISGSLDNTETTEALAWSFNSGSEAFNYLAAGESLVLTYTVQVDDGTAQGTDQIVITINGSNDAPVLSIESGDSDAQSLTETDAGLTVANTITVTDVDVTNNVTPSVTTVVESGTTSGISNATLLAMMTMSGSLDNTETTEALGWTFNSGSEAFNYLGAGDSLILTYTVQVSDGTATDTDQIVITINGSNDAPSLSVETGDSDAESLTETNAGLSVADTITVTDIDVTDTVSSSVTTVAESGTTSGIANATLLGYMSISGSLDNTETTEALAWSFNSGSEAFNYLAAGESLVLTYTVQVSDGTATDTDQIVITINGTNDAPVLSIESGDSDAQSLTETDAGLTVADTITVTDLDTTNTVSSSVTTVVESGTTSGIANATLLGYLSISGSLDNTETTEALAWTFNSGSQAFNYLAAGESLILTYTVQVDDSTVQDTDQIVITINGTNDAPVLSVESGDSDAETLTETDAGLSVADTITVTDLDTTNTVSSSVTTVVESGTTSGIANSTLLGYMSLTGSLDNTETTEALAWSFNSGSQNFNYLAAGQSLVLTYTVQVDDGTAQDTDEIVITIQGSNDAPVLSVESGDSDVESLTETNAGLSVADTITVTDVDVANTVTPSVTTVVESGTTSGIANATLLGMMTMSGSLDNSETTEALGWSFNSGSEAFNYLAAGESLILTYTVQVSDGTATDTDQIVITINGTNDAPVFSIESGDSDAESLTETNSGLTVNDTITVTDLDVTNTTTASIASVAETGTTSGIANATLLGMMTIAEADGGPSGGLDNDETTEPMRWTFNSGSEAFNYLSAGESLILTYTAEVTDGTATGTDQIVITINGTNDAPVLSVESGDSDAETLTETNAGLSVADTITVTDIDLTDTVSSSITTVVESGKTSGYANATLLGYMSITGDLSATETTEALAWSFNSGTEAFNYLAAGESLVLTYTVQVDDGTAQDTDQIVITINGTNDAPVLSIETGDSDAESLTETNAGLTVDDTITLTDLDITNTTTSSVTTVVETGTTSGIANATLLAMMTFAEADGGPSGGLDNDETSESMAWTFNSGSEAFNYLAAGESLVLTYTLEVDDGTAQDTHQVVITINGTNDAPVLSVETGDSDAETLTETNAGLSVADTITVTDLDTTNTVSSSVTTVVESGTTSGIANATLLGWMSISGSLDATETTEALAWSFNSGTQNFDYLAAGESLVLTYTIQVDDGTAQDTDNIVITINGTNDDPVFSIEAGDSDAESLTETDAGLTVADTITVTDVDLSNTVTPSVTTVVESGTTSGYANATLLGYMTMSGSLDATETTEALGWTFNSGTEAFNFLAAGESLVLTYTVQVSDGTATDTDQIVITINGTNDAPVISLEAGDSAAETLTETNAGLTVDDTLTLTDLDRSNTTTSSVTTVVESGTTSGIANATLLAMMTFAEADGGASGGLDAGETTESMAWTFNSGGQAFNYLSNGESLVLTYTVQVDDGTAQDTQDIVITIQGSNDAPVLSVETGDSDAETLTETNGGLTVADTITVTDIDTTNTVSSSVTTVVESGTTSGYANATLLGYMSISGSLDATETTEALAWSFNSGTEAFNYLAAGESLILTYTVQVDDGTSQDTDNIVITINGTNDAPVLSIESGDSDAQSLTETDAGLSVADTITVTDLDISNTVSSSVTTVVETGTTSGYANGTLLGYMSISGSLNNTETTEALAWSFNSGSEAFNFLSAGESLILTYTVQVDDGTAQDTDQIVITINGTNDEPVLSIETGDSDAKSLDEANGGLSVADTITVTDPDITNTVGSSVISVVESGETSGIANATLLGWMSITGSLDNTETTEALAWSFNSGTESFNYLSNGESLVLTYTVQVDDGTVQDTDQIVITINGTNDTPVVNDQAFDVDENTANGTIVGTVVATDQESDGCTPGAGDPGCQDLTYDISGSQFSIDSEGVIRVADVSQLDREAVEEFVLTVTVTDDGTPIESDDAQITITINPVNDNDPVGEDDTVSVDEQGTITFNVLTEGTDDSDADLPAETLSVSKVDGDAAKVGVVQNLEANGKVVGTLVINSDGSATFTATSDNTVEEFQVTQTYTVSDGTREDTGVLVTININPLNDNEPELTAAGTAYAAAGESYNEGQHTSTSKKAITLNSYFRDLDLDDDGILDSSTGGDLDTLTFSVSSNDNALLLQTEIDGSTLYLYSPTQGHGVANISITATDSAAPAAAISDVDLDLTVTVISINDPPVYVPGTYTDLTVDEDAAAIVFPLDDAFTDHDIDNDLDATDDSHTYTITIVDVPAIVEVDNVHDDTDFVPTLVSETLGTPVTHSRTSVYTTTNPTFGFEFEPDAHGYVDITIRASDEGRPPDAPAAAVPLYSEQSFRITVQSVGDDTPVAEDDEYDLGSNYLVMNEDDPVGLVIDVMDNDYLGDAPSQVINAGQEITGTFGEVYRWRTTARLSDRDNTGDFSLEPNGEVTCLNAGCSGATDDTVVSGSGLLKNQVWYLPEPDFNGEDSFLYCIQDNHPGAETPATFTVAASDPRCATVTVYVKPVNDLPRVPESIIYTMDQASDLILTDEEGLASKVSGVDNTNIDGLSSRTAGAGACAAGDADCSTTADTLYFFPQALATANGNLFDFETDGSFSYRPSATFSGSDSFLFDVCETPVQSAETCIFDQLVTIIVEPIIGAPVGSTEGAVEFDFDLADVPLELPVGPEANVMLVNDDSGSMDWDILTDQSNGLYYFPDGNYLYYVMKATAGSNSRVAPGEEDAPGSGLWRLRNSTYNTVYYNPEVRYDPWEGLDPDDNEFPAATPTRALHDPMQPSGNWTNLRIPQDYTGRAYVQGVEVCNTVCASYFKGSCTSYEEVCTTESGWEYIDVEDLYLPRYYTWEDKNNNTVLDEDPSPLGADAANSEGTLIEIRPASEGGSDTYTKYENRTDCAASDHCTYDEELQNFANWFTYSRNREFTAKSALGKVVSSAENIRIGYAKLNSSSNIQQIESMNSSERTGAKADLLDAIYLTGSSGGTPLRRALRNTGRYYACAANDIFGHGSSRDPGDDTCPVLAAPGGNCQQNFTLLISDGTWNGGDPGVGDEDDNNDTNFDGGIFAGSTDNTLADVAMKYYEEDMHNDLDNEVPTTSRDTDRAADDAFEDDDNVLMHQHMKTYTIGFGVNGSVDPDTVPVGYSGSFYWGNPSSSAGKVDDMLHAAVNGRGEYLSASNTNALTDALEQAFQEFQQHSGAAAAVSFNSQEILEDTLVFRSFYNTKNNTGDLVAQPIDLDGNVGDPVWNAAARLDLLDPDDRNIFTLDRDYVSGTGIFARGIPFRPNTLNTTQRNLFIDPATTDPTLQDIEVTQKVNYLRGDDEQERPVGNFRERPGIEGRLGDIVHSAPTFIGVPTRLGRDAEPFPQDDLYSLFKGLNEARQPVVYVAANDGMLHGFDANDGDELMAYVPDNLMTNPFSQTITELLNYEYSHRYFVDLTPAVNDVYIDADLDGDKEWRTVLVGGQGAGAKAFFALDVTDPTKFDELTAEAVALWEFTEEDDSYPTDSAGDPLVDADDNQRLDLQTVPQPIKDMGYSYSVPSIVMTNLVDPDGENKWVAIFGNGYNSTSGIAKLFVLFLDEGIDGLWCHPDMIHNEALNGTMPTDCVAKQDFVKLDTGFGAQSGVPNGLGEPRAIDVDANGTVDYVYAGDIFGNFFRFDLTDSNYNDWSVTKIFQAQYKPGTVDEVDQPITTQPIAVVHPTEDEGYILVFGTGAYMRTGDATDENIQSIYGLWDRLGPELITKDQLVEQEFTNLISTFGRVRTLSDNYVDYSIVGQKKGWFIDLDAPPAGNPTGDPEFPGEKAVRNIQLRGGLAFVNSIFPRELNSCVGRAGGATLSFCPDTGGSLCFGGRTIFDLNNDGAFNDDDDVNGDQTAAGIILEDPSPPTDSTFIGDKRVTQYGRELHIIGTNTSSGDNTGRLSWKQLETVE